MLGKYLFETEFVKYNSRGEPYAPYKITDIKYGYRGFVGHYLSQIDLGQIGFNHLVGDDYFRITYRFFGEKINESYGTASVFPSQTVVNYLESE